MCKEISPWKFVVNALFFAKNQKPLSLDPENGQYIWKYVLIASRQVEKELNLCVHTDKYSLENVLWNDNLFIKIEDNKLILSEDCQESDIDQINEYLDPSVTKKLPAIFSKAYAALK